MPPRAALKYDELKGLLAGPKPAPAVLFLGGPETYFKEEAIGHVARAVERTAGGEVTRVTLDAGSAELDSLFSTHLTVSLFGGWKLIVVRGLDRARASDRKTFFKSLAECQIPATIRLVLLSEEMKTAPPELKGLEVVTAVFYVPWKSELLRWMGDELKRRQVAFGRDVPEMLYRMHGKAVPWKTDLELDIHQLSGAIERLARHVRAMGLKGVDEKVVRAVLGAGEPPDVFRLVDLVARRDRAAALRGLRAYLNDAQESPIPFVAMLLDRFDKLLRIEAAKRAATPAAWQEVVRRARAAEAALRFDQKRTALEALSGSLASLGPAAQTMADLKDYQKPAFVLQADAFGAGELHARFASLVDLDRRLKSGAGDEKAEVELFVARG